MNLKLPLESRPYPFGEPILPEPDPHYAELRRECRLTNVRTTHRHAATPHPETCLCSRHTEFAEF